MKRRKPQAVRRRPEPWGGLIAFALLWAAATFALFWFAP